MQSRVKLYFFCFTISLSTLLIVIGSRYTNNIHFYPSSTIRITLTNLMKPESIRNIDCPEQLISTKPADGQLASKIEKILEETHSKIKCELRNYEFTHSSLYKFKYLHDKSGGSHIRTVIVSTWRAGATFLAEALDAVPGNFYHCEPLSGFGMKQIRSKPQASRAIKNIKSMLKCDFKDAKHYFEYGKKHVKQFSHNTRLWNHCRYNKELCGSANFTSKFCKLFPFQTMKIVRMRLRLVKDLLKDKKLKVKVVLLIRDPRGVMQSRERWPWCPPSQDCKKPNLLCTDMISDYNAAGQFSQMYPDRFMVLRYEELALNTNAVIFQLFKFLGLHLTESIKKFIHTHTTIEVEGVSSTFRVSRYVPFRWKQMLDFDHVIKIQEVCEKAMKLWGYRLASNASQLKSKDFYPLDSWKLPK